MLGQSEHTFFQIFAILLHRRSRRAVVTVEEIFGKFVYVAIGIDHQIAPQIILQGPEVADIGFFVFRIVSLYTRIAAILNFRLHDFAGLDIGSFFAAVRLPIRPDRQMLRHLFPAFQQFALLAAGQQRSANFAVAAAHDHIFARLVDLGGLLSMLVSKGLHQNFVVIFFDGFSNGVDKIYIGISRSRILPAISAFAVVAVAVVLVNAVNHAPILFFHPFAVFFNKSFKLFGKGFAGCRIAVTGAVRAADGGFVFGSFGESSNIFAESMAAVGRTEMHGNFAITVAH